MHERKKESEMEEVEEEEVEEEQEEQKDTVESSAKRFARLGCIAFIWFVSNSLASAMTQQALKNPDNHPLDFVDLAMLNLLVGLVLLPCGSFLLDHPIRLSMMRAVESEPRVSGLVLCHFLGIIGTNGATQFLGSPSVQVAKTLEPLVTIGCSVLFFNTPVTLELVGSVTAIVLGILFSLGQGGELEWNFLGGMVVGVAIVALPLRNILSKTKEIKSVASTSTELFFNVVLLLTPFAVFLSASKTFVTGAPPIFTETHFLSAVCYNLYNLASIAFLLMTDAITHSVMNVLKRVFVISFVTVYFSVSLSLIQKAGLSVSVFGFCLFMKSKSFDIPTWQIVSFPLFCFSFLSASSSLLSLRDTLN